LTTTADNGALRPTSVVIVAGEESGDALGAALAKALRAQAGSGIAIAGVGGHAMADEGIVSPFPIGELAIIGLTAIPKRLPQIFRRIRETADLVIASRPDVLVIVDSPDFSHRVARRVRRAAPSIPIIDYVSPTVWAWRPGRAKAMRGYVDHVLAILPFEPEVHERLGGPPCTYVGHPLIERLAELRPDAREQERRRADPPILLALPGSRSTEIRRLAGLFGKVLALTKERVGAMEVVMPTVPHVAALVHEAAADWPVAARIVVEPAEKWAAFRSARAALAASGTVTLELALSGVPMVATYRLHPVEATIARLIRIRSRLQSVILANLVIGENVVPEFIHDNCTPENLAGALVPVVGDTPERRRQVEAFARLDSILAVGGPPSDKAAAIVLDFARRGRNPGPRESGP
jgi:lipid-A-disaccharide synthase